MVQEIPSSLTRGIDRFLAELLSEVEIPFFTDGVPSNSGVGSVVYGRLGEAVLTYALSDGWRAVGARVPIPVTEELMALAPAGSILVDGIPDNPKDHWGEEDDEGNRYVYKFTFPPSDPTVAQYMVQGLIIFRQVMTKHGLHVARRFPATSQ